MKSRPLFTSYPALESKVPLLDFGSLPTPLHRLDGLCGKFGHEELFIKRDDLSCVPYGGNKIRKLEFLLADAKKRGATRIITSGAAGSNHALATALYGRKYGFEVTLMLVEQPYNPSIAKSLLADYATGAEMLLDEHYHRHVERIGEVAEKYRQIEGVAPYIIPPGGSSAVGVLGYVNAAFELKEQIDRGTLPEPATIYCTLGTAGTAAGLLLGMQAAGIRGKLVSVRVVPKVVASIDKIEQLFMGGFALLREADPSFPECQFDASSLEVNDDFFGEGYGISNPATDEAIRLFSSHDNLTLDPVYTGKTAAAFIAEARKKRGQSEPMLFLHSKSAAFPDVNSAADAYKMLPEVFHHYFEGKG